MAIKKKYGVEYTTETINTSKSIDPKGCSCISFEVDESTTISTAKVNDIPLTGVIREFNNNPEEIILNNFSVINPENLNIYIIRTFYYA